VLLLEWDFFPDDAQPDRDSFLDRVGWLLASLYRHGALVDRGWHLVGLEDRARYYGIIPAEDALDERHYNRYIREEFDRVVALSRQPPSFRILGKAAELGECCACQDPSWYVLLTTFLKDEPPVRCGGCGRPVPLYRIPRPPDDEEHSGIRRWAGAYQAYDTLYMLSGVGERSSYRQMSRLDSLLTREGRQVCEAMAGRTGKPWYYYLHRDYSPQRKDCPGCGGRWALEAELHGLYDYRCDRCCLLSVEPVCSR